MTLRLQQEPQAPNMWCTKHDLVKSRFTVGLNPVTFGSP